MLSKFVLGAALVVPSVTALAYDVVPGGRGGFVDYVATAEKGDFDSTDGKLNDQYWLNLNDEPTEGCFLKSVDLDLRNEAEVFRLKPSINVQGRLRVDSPAETERQVLKLKLFYKLKGDTRTRIRDFTLLSGQFEQVYNDPQAGWTLSTLSWQDFTWPAIDIGGKLDKAWFSVCDATGGAKLQISELRLSVLLQL
jgi:hypothetical protein